MRERRPNFAGRSTQIKLEKPTTYHLPDWDGYKDPKKLALLRQIVLQYGRDPRVAQLAVKICQKAGAKPREYRKQAQALLAWVQHNIYYVNEPGERLQSPLYTLKSGLGDCDELAILLCSLFECVRLPWKMVITANTREGIVRYIEGDPNYRKLPYSHIYCMTSSGTSLESGNTCIGSTTIHTIIQIQSRRLLWQEVRSSRNCVLLVGN